MGHNAQMEQEDNRPKWLLELENRKRKPRLAHELGAGAPCIKCSSDCPGLDLHFWRKICKNCKCGRDDHDVPDEEFPQFDLLFGPTGMPKKKTIVLKRQSGEETFEWAPPDTSKELAADYMKALPEDKLPIKGSTGAALRKQQLQKQLPLHDIDHKVCDELTDSERKQFEKYLENLKNYVGQGKVSKLSTARPFDRTLMTPANASECFSPKHKSAVVHGNSPNLRTPSSFVSKKGDGLDLPQNQSSVVNDPALLSSRREILPNPTAGQVLSEASKLGRYHHILGNVKTDADLVHSSAVSGIEKPITSLPTVGRPSNHENSSSIPGAIGQTPVGCEPSVSQIGHQTTAHSFTKPSNTALHFAQSNLHNISPEATTGTLYAAQYQRIGEMKPEQPVSDQAPLRSHQWAKKLDKSAGRWSPQGEKSNLVDQMLSEALLPPSSIHSNDIIGSTLDKKGLSYIREKLSSKYGERDQAPDLQAQNSPKSRDDSANPQGKNSKYHGVNSKPAPAQLSSYGGVDAHIIHSESLQNPVFPEEPTGTRRIPENLPVNQLTAAVEHMSLHQKEKCHQCSEDIVLGDVIVTAERAKDAAWHPGCFVCSICNELLVDLVYFYHKDKLYCGRDFAALLEIPRCFACDELIFVREYTVAEGHNYHVKHFCCWDCDMPLAGQQYISENDRPLCLPCYQKTYAKTCCACQKIIAAEQQGVAIKDLDFHASDECFCCANCKKCLLNGRMAIKEKKLFCSKECITTFFSGNQS